MVDGKDPAVAGNVPEKRVVVLEKAELAIRRVGDGIGMLADGHKGGVAAQVDAHAVAVVFDARLFRGVVAGGRQQRKADHITVPEPIGVASRKVAIDTVADQVSGAYNANGLADEHGAIVRDVDVTMVIEYALALRRPDRYEQEHACQAKQATETSKGWVHFGVHGRVCPHPHCYPHGCGLYLQPAGIWIAKPTLRETGFRDSISNSIQPW